MSGIGGHVNRGDRARRRDHTDELDAYLRHALREAYREHLDAGLDQLARELGLPPLPDWQRRSIVDFRGRGA